MKNALKSRLRKDWRKAHHLWRVRLPLGWAALSGLYAAWSGAQDHMPAWLFISLSSVISVALTAGHVLNLPGADDAR